ncbi:MAG: phosphoglucomutase/phosphomannomutase family protein [Candidatus Gastranaerophilales bacterium]|nr:phosphoglucomutase/phosphomannomutase family protein [Candidatus Gastranaerophilales bacterium]
MAKEDIKFGTDGYRAIIGEKFTFENVELIVKSISCYAKKHYGIEKPLLVGYDTRFMADKFASFAADLLKTLGHKVLLSESYIPTPALAFCAKEYNSAGALMFTASHNPPEYCGIKYIPDYAGPATSDITNELIENLGLEQGDVKEGTLTLFNAKKDYFAHLNTIIDFEKIKTLKTTICFDPLYATANGWFDEILKEHNLDVKIIHNWRDPLFGGCMPEPKDKYLGEFKFLVLENHPAVGFSNDGDADRYAIIDENGYFVTPNEVMAILLNHLLKYKNAKGSLVKTVAGSLMLDKIAEHYGIDVIETAVGFKHVGEAMRNNQTVIGGEESGGLSIGSHIPEKDGILANLLMLEAVAYSGKTIVELRNEISEIINAKYINKRFDLKLTEEEKSKSMDLFLNNPPEEFYGKKIKNICKKDGVKFYLEGGNDWILIRFSGTEPLLRIYFESLDAGFIDSAYNEIRSLI